MSVSYFPVLSEFSADIPSCARADALPVLLDRFSRGSCDRLVVLDSNRIPQGVVYLYRCLPYLTGSREISTVPTAAELLEPFATLPASLSVSRLWLYLHYLLQGRSLDRNPLPYLLVDERNRYVGWLESDRLLEHLAASNAEQTEIVPYDAGDPYLSLWVQFLSRIPLPVRLQTDSGKTIAESNAWQEHFGMLQEPESVREEVSAFVRLLHGEEEEAIATQQAGRFCQPGRTSDDCICTFPMKGGGERVWRFVKVLVFDPARSGRRQPSYVSVPKTAIARNAPAIPFTAAPSETREPLPSEEPTISSAEKLWLVFAQDVTAQQHLSQELTAKNADLVRLNRLKDEFLACISHELKTPLTAVLGLSSLLKDEVFGKLNDRQMRYARLIYQSGRHLMSVVNDILDLTRMETGQVVLVPEPAYLVKVCQQALQYSRDMRSTTSDDVSTTEETESGPAFSLDIEPGLEAIVADELRLRQILGHLLSNAFKFTPPEGRVGLKIGRWAGWIAFTVWDTGIGIAADKQHLIFQKFQQLETPLTRRFEGAGLGLVLSQRLARLHGGDISFISKEGEGSQFTLLLPPFPPHAPEEAERWGDIPLPTMLPSPGNRLVLIVEASARTIDNLTPHLTKLGYQVLVARSGTDALEKARRFTPEAIFLNPFLPLLSGWDVLTLLKSESATQHVPTIVIGTLADRDRAEAAADGFLKLPPTEESIARCLDEVRSEKCDRQPKLTVLQLHADDKPFISVREEGDREWLPQLNALLHHNSCRILEADDLEQAEMLARIWQPDVTLLMPPASASSGRRSEIASDPASYLTQLEAFETLARIPLVVVDPIFLQTGNPAADDFLSPLPIFPCRGNAAGELPDPATLLEVIRLAAGLSGRPSALIVDLCALPDLPGSTAPSSPQEETSREWLRALVQYMEQGGMKSLLGRSWIEVWRQVQCQSVDLVLLWVRGDRPHAAMAQALVRLAELENKPPILVLDHRNNITLRADRDRTEDAERDLALTNLLAAIAHRILPGHSSVSQLFEQIEQTLKLK